MLWTKGVETGRLTPNEFVAVTSTNIAQILNIYPQKGAILPGSDADLVVWDPKLSKTISAANQKSIIDYNVFEGIKVNGQARYTLSRGEVVWSYGQNSQPQPGPRQARQAQAVPGGQQGAVDLEGTDRAARRHALGRTYADRRLNGLPHMERSPGVRSPGLHSKRRRVAGVHAHASLASAVMAVSLRIGGP